MNLTIKIQLRKPIKIPPYVYQVFINIELIEVNKPPWNFCEAEFTLRQSKVEGYSLLSKVITGALNFELLTKIFCAIYSIDLIHLSYKNRHVKIVWSGIGFIPSLLKLYLYKSCFFVSPWQVWLTAIRSNGQGKEKLVSFKARHTAVTFYLRDFKIAVCSPPPPLFTSIPISSSYL